MKSLLLRLAGLLLAIGLLLLTSCAHGDELASALSQPLDSAVRHQFASRKLKFTGPVTIQVGGTGNTATTTDASRAKAPVAAGPHATASETKTAAGLPWWLYLVAGLLLVAGGFWLRGKLRIPLPF